MIQNLAWAAGYNIVAIPLAAGASRLGWHHAVPGGRRRADEPVDDRRRPQCSVAPAPPTSARPDRHWARIATSGAVNVGRTGATDAELPLYDRHPYPTRRTLPDTAAICTTDIELWH